MTDMRHQVNCHWDRSNTLKENILTTYALVASNISVRAATERYLKIMLVSLIWCFYLTSVFIDGTAKFISAEETSLTAADYHERTKRNEQKYYLKSCLDIQTHSPDSLSGLYSIQPVPGGKVITVYCEMAIAGGGFTFVPRTAIRGIESKQMITELFTRRTQVLMRIQNKDGTQPYTLVQQLPEYKQHLLGVRVNNFDGYTSPANSHLGDYLLLGILPPDVAGVDGKVLGFQSNGKPLRYTNCGGGTSNLFVFLPDHSELLPSNAHADNLIYEREGMAVEWRNTAVRPPSGRTMPNDFFFLTEVHMAGCGCYTSSDRWIDALGTAIGFR